MKTVGSRTQFFYFRRIFLIDKYLNQNLLNKKKPYQILPRLFISFKMLVAIGHLRKLSLFVTTQDKYKLILLARVSDSFISNEPKTLSYLEILK